MFSNLLHRLRTRKEVDSAPRTCDTPVVFLIYNRPEPTKRVFKAIRRAKPKKLLVIADGPKSDEDAKKVAKTRSIVSKTDWPCEVMHNFSDTNLGCRERYTTGIDWVFQHVEQAIFIEDDCLPDPTFFPFCEELLERYKTDERIRAIQGTNMTGAGTAKEYSYFFSKYFRSWGWAGWRRAYAGYDSEMSDWPEFLASGGMRNITDSAEEEACFTEGLASLHRKLLDSWAYTFQYFIWSQGGLVIVPRQNLISNIGFGEEATHTFEDIGDKANFPTEPIHDILHPPFVVRDKLADMDSFRSEFGFASKSKTGGAPDDGSEDESRVASLESQVVQLQVDLIKKEDVIQQQHRDILNLNEKLAKKSSMPESKSGKPK